VVDRWNFAKLALHQSPSGWKIVVRVVVIFALLNDSTVSNIDMQRLLCKSCSKGVSLSFCRRKPHVAEASLIIMQGRLGSELILGKKPGRTLRSSMSFSKLEKNGSF